jgi:signal transduction histidine kinase
MTDRRGGFDDATPPRPDEPVRGGHGSWGHGSWGRGPWGRGPWGGARPPWWPEDQAWPPQGPGAWGMMRRRFMVRFGLFVLAFFSFVVLVNVLVFHGFNRTRGRPFWPVLAVLVVIGLVLLTRGIRRVAAPVGDVMEAADRVADGDYSVRVQERGTLEVRRLSRAFNEMTERLGTNEERRRNLLADVTHELRTPLAVIQANLEGLVDGLYPTDEAHIAPILEETRVMARLLDDLQTLSTAEAGALRLRREAVAPNELVDEAVAAFRTGAADAGVALEARTPTTLPMVWADRVRVGEVFANLLSNAIRHTPAGGSVTVAAGLAGTSVWFDVADTGRGIEAAELPHVFDRFRKSADSRGMGLGLAIAKSLVEAHGGTIVVRSEPGLGTTIRMTLPTATS